MNYNNPILNTDSYKISHFKQYEEGTERVFSYVESRGGKYDETLVFGLQAFIKSQLMTPITMEDINEAEVVCKLHGFEDFNRPMWERIVKVHGGKLPIEIKAVPEGTVVPTKNVLVTIENTDPECAALTSYLETALLRGVWYPTTVATTSYKIKQVIRQYLEETSDAPEEELPFKLHDFGARGVSSKESAGIGGLAHLVNFMGTDTIEALLTANRFYNVDITDPNQMPAFSIPAAEHSTITSWGREREEAAMRNMVKQFGRHGALVAVVSDSYDIYNAADKIWGEVLKDQVLNSGATVVVRPDSGDPVEVTLKVIQLLEKNWGTEVNSKGYKVLPPSIRIIQGDGVNIDSITAILENFKQHGYSASNIAFGMGGALLQGIDRDTQKFALKCSSMRINGADRDVFKDPITDPGKVSKKGRLMLFRDKRDGSYATLKDCAQAPWHERALRTVFLNGKLVVDENLAAIRERSES